MMYNESIIKMLFKAYFDARKNKRSKHSQVIFELNLEENIFELYNDIMSGKYEIGQSICFIINKPVKREIFAANFRDRVIHHFLFSILNPLVEKELLHDIYSCRKRKGTLFGVKRAHRKMQSCSHNYTQKAFVLKLDISGYFMNMNKDLLYGKVMRIVEKYKGILPINQELLTRLIAQNIYHDPTFHCKFQSDKKAWIGLPKNKSLFHTSPQCGLPIGNLTSQLYGNLYLNDFDHFIKYSLKIKHYGRYVDDFYFFDLDHNLLVSVVKQLRERLFNNEHLILHPNKIYLQNIEKGFLFLGVFILPFRRYIGKRIKSGAYQTLTNFAKSNTVQMTLLNKRLQSYKSMLLHHNCKKLYHKIEIMEEYMKSKTLAL